MKDSDDLATDSGVASSRDAGAPDSGTPGPGPQVECPSYSGFKAGTRKLYRAHTGGATHEVEVLSFAHLGDRIELQVRHTARFTIGSDEVNYEYFRCDAEGIKLTAYTSGDEEFRYEPPVLELPTELSAGTAWVRGPSERYRDGALDGRIYSSYSAAGPEQVTTPAGTFEALRIADEEGAGDGSLYAEGIGLVQTSYLELVEFSD